MDRKYGHLFTEADVTAILQWAWDDELPPAKIMQRIINDDHDIRLKFDRDEPLFCLRGRDRRAEGAIMHYEDHQAPNAPRNHVEGIAASRRDFREFREANPGRMKEPD